MQTQIIYELHDFVDHKVDESEPFIIKDVKILGKTSKNGRSYSERTLKAAVNKFENCAVYINHPKDRSKPQEREYETRLGTLKNCHYVQESQDNRADFHINPYHPHAKSVLWDIKQRTDKVGFSQSAKVMSSGSNVEDIVEVYSVDLVSNPATMNTVFESIDCENQEIKTLSENLNTLTEENKNLKDQVTQLVHEVQEIKNKPKPVAIAPTLEAKPEFDMSAWLNNIRLTQGIR